MNSLQEQRIRVGLKQSDVAKYLVVKETTISNYETGKRTPPIYMLKAYADILEVCVEDLIDLIVVGQTKKIVGRNI